jgi:hypothetical protein
MRLSIAARKMILVIIITSLIFIAGGAAFYRSPEAVAFAAAAALMAGLNVIKVYMIERTVHKSIDMDDANEGKNYVRLQYLVRFAITGVILAAAALFTGRTGLYGSVWGAVAGVFTFQIAAFCLRFFNLEEDEKEGS